MDVIWDLVLKIATLVGLIWALIALIKWIMAYIGRTQLKGLEGIWYEYHWTNPDGANTEFKWLESTLIAEPKLFSSYKLLYTNNGVPFCGIARYIDRRDEKLSGDILLEVQQKKREPMSEEATIYFRYNIPERQIGDNNEIAGIWLSYNFDKDITSGASILSKSKIPQNELNAKFEEYFEVNKASIVVKNNGTSGSRKFFWEFWK
jgi:hypothetical protein